MHELTRRSFANLLAVGGLTYSLPLAHRCAAAAPRKPIELAIISDTHLGYRDQETARKQWETTARELAKCPGEHVIHLGDVVDGGRESQYAIYKEIRDTVRKPVHEIPGNHDPAELFAKHIRPQIDSVVELDWLRLLLVNNARPESHDGFLTSQQLEWIDARCGEAARDGRSVIVCMHVPAHKNLHPDRGWYVKPTEGQTALYSLLERRRSAVLALFHGHFHNGVRGWDDHKPVHEICFPSALYNQDRKLREQNAPGYNLAEFRPGYTQVRATDEQIELAYQPLVGTPTDAARHTCPIERPS